MVTNVAVPGGWEIALMLVMSTVMLGGALLAVYLVVRLAVRHRRSPVDDQHK
jgi:hypothetical protein